MLYDGTKTFSKFIYKHISRGVDYVAGFNSGNSHCVGERIVNKMKGKGSSPAGVGRFEGPGVCLTRRGSRTHATAGRVACSLVSRAKKVRNYLAAGMYECVRGKQQVSLRITDN